MNPLEPDNIYAIFNRGLRQIAEAASQDPHEGAHKYGTDFENGIFMMHSFCWCEQPGCYWCEQNAPNFWCKPTGFKLWWYKYIGRSMEVNFVPQQEEAIAIVQACMESLKLDATTG